MHVLEDADPPVGGDARDNAGGHRAEGGNQGGRAADAYRIVRGEVGAQKHRKKHVEARHENQGRDGRSEGCEGNG